MLFLIYLATLPISSYGYRNFQAARGSDHFLSIIIELYGSTSHNKIQNDDDGYESR